MEQFEELLNTLGSTHELLVRDIAKVCGAPVVKTIYSHSDYKEGVIGGTQKKGVVIFVTNAATETWIYLKLQEAATAILKRVRADIEACEGCNACLLNFFCLSYADPTSQGLPGVIGKIKIQLRGCPTIVP